MVKSMKEKHFNIPTVIAVALFFVLGFYVPVSADIGPKPSIKITVMNPPEGGYYVALLSQKGGLSTDIAERELKPEEKDIALYFAEYNQDGYSVFISPVGQNIQKNNSEGIYIFHYMVPENFKVLLLTADGKEYVSNPINKSSFHADCTFDAGSGILKEQIYTNYNVLKTLISIFICFTVTVLTEMLVLPMFALPFKKNLKHIWFINIVTQIFLNAVILFSSNILIWAAAEILIIITESLYYRKRLINRKGENNKGRNIVYAVAANLFSLIHELPVVLLVNIIFMYNGFR